MLNKDKNWNKFELNEFDWGFMHLELHTIVGTNGKQIFISIEF